MMTVLIGSDSELHRLPHIQCTRGQRQYHALPRMPLLFDGRRCQRRENASPRRDFHSNNAHQLLHGQRQQLPLKL